VSGLLSGFNLSGTGLLGNQGKFRAIISVTTVFFHPDSITGSIYLPSVGVDFGFTLNLNPSGLYSIYSGQFGGPIIGLFPLKCPGGFGEPRGGGFPQGRQTGFGFSIWGKGVWVETGGNPHIGFFHILTRGINIPGVLNPKGWGFPNPFLF